MTVLDMVRVEHPEYGNVDKACVNLLDAMNSLPGVATSESCCGHGKGFFDVWFKMDSASIGAVTLSRCLSGRYYNYREGETFSDLEWEVVLDHGDIYGLINFRLRGRPMLADGSVHPPAEKLARNIMEHVEGGFPLRDLIMRDDEFCRGRMVEKSESYKRIYDKIIVGVGEEVK